MQNYWTYPAFPPRSQAIPMAVYRRQLFFAQWRPRILILLFALAMYPIAASPWTGVGLSDRPFPAGLYLGLAERVVDSRPAVADVRPDLVVVVS